MSACPKCHRPFNEGNSPNAAECHETDDDEGLCKAYAMVHALTGALKRILNHPSVPADSIQCCRDARKLVS